MRYLHAISALTIVLVAAAFPPSPAASAWQAPAASAWQAPAASAGQPPLRAATAGQAPQGRGGGFRDAFPPRPPADPAVVERGRALYSVNCAFCHGADTRGGDSGPSLLRSGRVLDDQHGELIGPIVLNGRVDRGMPKFTFTMAQVEDIADFIHTFRAAGYDESRMTPPSILVGDATAGATFFNAKCASCHSPTGDLHGIGARFTDPKLLQQSWLMPGSGGRVASSLVTVPPTMVTVTLPSGEKIDGELDRLDDFGVSLTEADGTHRSFRTDGDTPKVEVHDPLQPHKDLLRMYRDADIHNVTAYLVTLK
ncbi:MAG: c-type cytochrome [Acidobacteria bacterium]|nr:c-type cytochrome [Acidobacteriota bacterium]